MDETLNDVIVKISAIVSQTTDVTAGSDEYVLWTSYVNIAQLEAINAYDWRNMYREYNTRTSTSTGNATIPLPKNFDQLFGFPVITADGVNTHEYGEVDPQTRSQLNDSEKYVYILDDIGQKYMVVNPGTLASGASIYIPYKKALASLSSSGDKIEFSSDYLVKRAVALVWQAREDERFMGMQAEAEKILSRMIEKENTRSPAYDSSVKSVLQTKWGFRIGRD